MNWISTVALASLMTAWVGTTAAQMDPGGTARGNEVRLGRDSAAGRVVATVYEARFAFVRIEQREPGADLNQHPAQIEPARLRALLERLQLPDKAEPLFAQPDLEEIVPPLASALAKATPEQDVSFAVSGRYGFIGPLAARVVTTARVFRRDDRLNVIVGLVRSEFENQFRATGYLVPFEPGRRAKPVDTAARVSVQSGAGDTRRADWAVLALDAPTATPLATGAQPAPAVGAAASGSPTSRPAPPPATAAPADSEVIYREVSERLKALQKLRDNGVITEQEYQEKRRQILKDL
ncbi:MAG TPA: SHOCT domain-containing protein [Burkholderiaceae bacterium]|nr:SHOCT domain-containing protein [Burkholderiaceae bacterium]